jgi:hypothetical protein
MVKRQWKKQLGRPRLTFEVLLERILKNWGERAWTELNWLRIGCSGGLM